MGKSAPKPPDPIETGKAQTSTNVATSIANAIGSQVNQITPQGNLTFDTSGSYSFTDPVSGETYEIPYRTATTSYSPEQQALYETGVQTEQNLADIAKTQSARIGDILNTPVSTEGLPDWANWGNLDTTSSILPQLAGVNGGDITGMIAGLPTESLMPMLNSIGSGEDVRNKVEQALMARMDPYVQQDRERLRSELINQGIRQGSTGWDNSMDEWNRELTDARYAAILNAGEEASRIFNMDLSRFGAAQSELSRLFGEGAATAGLTQQELQRQFGNTLQTLGVTQNELQRLFGQETTALSAQDQMRKQQLEEALALRGVPINEIIGLMSGAQVAYPQWAPAPAMNMPTTDYAGLINENYNQQLQNYYLQQQQMGGLFGSIANIIPALPFA